MNGLGFSLRWAVQVVMASIRLGALVNVPRRRRRSVSSLNQRTTRFNHELDVDGLEEREDIGSGVPLAALGDDLTGGDVQCREQVRGPVAFVVARHRPGPAVFAFYDHGGPSI